MARVVRYVGKVIGEWAGTMSPPGYKLTSSAISLGVRSPLGRGPRRSENPALRLRGPVSAPKQTPRAYAADIC